MSLRDQGAAFAQQQCQVVGLVPSGKKEHGGWAVGEWMSREVCKMIYQKKKKFEGGENDGGSIDKYARNNEERQSTCSMP